MDSDHFDNLLRSVTSRWSRRGLMRTVAGLSVSGVLISTNSVAAKRRKGHKKKRCPAAPTRDTCPQRSCCQCNDSDFTPVSCTALDTIDFDAATAACRDVCGARGTFVRTFLPGRTTFCTQDSACVTVDCPV